MSTTTPIPTLTALAGLVEALEAVPCDGRCWPDAHEGAYERFGTAPGCPRTRATAALAVWRTRLPMAVDGDLALSIVSETDGDVPLDFDAVVAVLAALDARMGHP